MLMEHMKHVINPHTKASAVDSPGTGLVYNPVIRKTKLKMDENPYSFSRTEDLAHILVVSPGAVAKKIPFMV